MYTYMRFTAQFDIGLFIGEKTDIEAHFGDEVSLRLRKSVKFGSISIITKYLPTYFLLKF